MCDALMDSSILFVIGSLDIGGAERHLAMVAQALRRCGWRVSVYSLGGAGILGSMLAAQGVRVIVPPLARDRSRSPAGRHVRLAAASLHLLATMIRQRPTVAHFFLPQAYIIGAPLATLARVPVRLMSRRSLNLYQRKFAALRWIERSLHRVMHAIVGNSRAVIGELRDEESVPATKLGLIYNGIDLDDRGSSGIHSTVRASLGLSATRLLMATVANLIPYKGHADLFHALATARPQLPESWRLLVIGRDDGIGADLRKMAARLDLADNILFLGLRSDVPELLQACDIGLLCSHEEGFANAILEGMAAGLPMIVTDVGGNAEAVMDGETGFVVPARDPARLAEAIARLAADAPLRARLGRAGRRRVEEHFTLDRCVTQYEQLYRTLLAGGLPQDVPGIGITRCAALPG